MTNVETVTAHQQALWDLEDLGPSAPLHELEVVHQRLSPSPDRDFLAGFIAGRRKMLPPTTGGTDMVEGYWHGLCG